MDSFAPLSTELTVLGWSVVLLFGHVALQGQLASFDRGMDWNAGARDGEAKPLGLYAGRAERALKNFLETYPAFVALALGLAVSGRSGGLGETGAILWIAARLVYIPLYLFGVPYVRSLAWIASVVGLVLMLFRFL